MTTTMCLDLIVAGEKTQVNSSSTSVTLSIEEEESTAKRIERTVVESPVVVLSVRGCCLCHVMKKLLVSVGVHPVVIELEGKEDVGILSSTSLSPPVVFVGGELVGGLENLMGLHLSGELVLRLLEIQAL